MTETDMGSYHNIFYYYRGQQKDSASIDTQIENNTTKALINLLELVTDHTLRIRLISEISGIEDISSSSDIHYLMQVSYEPREKQKKVLLGISKSGLPPEIFEPEEISDSKPDAWILMEELVICIENKTGENELNGPQWKNHKVLLGGHPKEIYRSWRYDIYPIIEKLCNEHKDDIDGFLLNQFKEYLKLIKMEPFKGFDQNDVKFLTTELTRCLDIESKISSLINGATSRLNGAYEIKSNAINMITLKEGKGFYKYTYTKGVESEQVICCAIQINFLTNGRITPLFYIHRISSDPKKYIGINNHPRQKEILIYLKRKGYTEEGEDWYFKELELEDSFYTDTPSRQEENIIRFYEDCMDGLIELKLVKREKKNNA